MAIHHHTNIGDRFHMLVVQSAPFRRPDKFWYVECLCDCGNRKTIKCRSIVNGHTKACGCWKRANPPRGRVTHGLTRTAAWRSYHAMLTRCCNPKGTRYESYGGRGITVCERWQAGFENFHDDMGDRPPGTTLDRIDVDGPYSPENCRWATVEQQQNNTRQNRRLTYQGQTLSVAQWARETGITEHSIRVRIGLGWEVEKMLTLRPVLGRNQYSTD